MQFLGGIPANRFGRKNTLIWIGVSYSVSAIGSALSLDAITFGIFRFIGGVGVGASTVAAPAYISEIAPAKHRERLVDFYQLMLVFGILAAFISNYILSGIAHNDWRWMVGVEAFPTVIYTMFVTGVPKSPRWLLTKNRPEEARIVLAAISNETTLSDLQEEVALAQETENASENIFIKNIVFHLCWLFLSHSSINFLALMRFFIMPLGFLKLPV